MLLVFTAVPVSESAVRPWRVYRTAYYSLTTRYVPAEKAVEAIRKAIRARFSVQGKHRFSFWGTRWDYDYVRSWLARFDNPKWAEKTDTDVAVTTILAAEDSSDTVKIGFFPLRFVKAEDLVKNVESAFEVKEVETESANNALVVTAEASKLKKIAEFLHSIDREYRGATDEVGLKNFQLRTKVFPLQNFPAMVAEDILKNQNKKLGVASENIHNSVIVTATQKELEQIGKVLYTLDRMPVRESRVISTREFQVQYSDIRKAEDIIKNHFKPVAVDRDETKKSIIVTASEPVLDEIGEFVTAYDEEPPMILVEGTILKVNHNKAKQIGVEQSHEFTRTDNVPSGGASIASSYTLDFLGDIPQIMYKFSSEHGKTYEISLGALVDKGAAEIVLKPHITFVSGRSGKFEQVENIPQLSSSDKGTNVNFIKTGLSLYVQGSAVPTGPADEEGNIVYKIILDKLTITDGRKGDQVESDDKSAIAFFSQEVVFEAPQILDDGQLIILGGAINEDHSVAVQKIPGLGDVPVLKYLFRSDNITDKYTETLALLRLNVIKDKMTYAFKAAQFKVSKKLRPIEFGGDVNDSIKEHPLKTALWSSKIIYKPGGGFFERIYQKFDDEEMEKIDKMFKKRIRGRIKIIHNWENLELLRKLTEQDAGLEAAFVKLAEETRLSPYDILLITRHLGSINDPVFLIYYDFLKNHGML